MKKIRIETKSGELVKEFEGHIEHEYTRSNETSYFVPDLKALGLVVKEIEVEDRTPVKRWQWIFKEGHKYGRSDGYYTEEEANNFGPKKFIRKIENSVEEFEE